MKRLIKFPVFLLLLSFIPLGCPGNQVITALPVMPQYNTAEGKACGQSCQSSYTECNDECYNVFGAKELYRQLEQCLSTCNQTIKGCYTDCKEKDVPPR
jgi:hypothetical protein